MSYWGFWEWLTYVCIGIAALVLATDQAVKGSPTMIAHFSGLLKSPYWNYAPLVLIAISALLILGHQTGIIGTKVQNVGTEQPPLARPSFQKTSLKLQFFGDRRIPIELGSNNVATWFSYYSQSVKVSTQDAQGNEMPGGFEMPPNWVIFAVFDKAADYRQAVAVFSNPELSPPIEVRQTTTRSLVVTVGGMIPAGVLEISIVE